LVTGFNEILAADEGDTFELVDKATGEPVFFGQLSLVEEFDEKYSGEQILCADFSDFGIDGSYYLRADGIGDSLSFEISESVYDELLKNTMRYYYYQRANEEITSEYGGKYTRSDKTPKDFEAPLYYDRDVKIDVSGGWYDAGDVGKYVSPGATAANTLLWTYMMFPDCFSDGQNDIPESGNGIPDILDEVRVELDFLLKMQDKSGGFYIKVKSRSENDDDGERTVWVGDGDKCITNSTADCTAVLAFASKIFREHDPDYADTLLAAAERGWAYIEENPNIYTATNYSGENNSSSAFWASACVYYANGSESAHSWFLENADSYIDSLKAGANGHNVGNMGIYGYYTYLLCENRDEEAVSEIAEQLEGWKRAVLDRYKA
ncbi:MAG: glycoside hydrolase family 9 protein, partial [Oscillospiraceae bacterium]|nr:glycoside hydrolase family 9 protein [Oscillospiraceae bacterium]